MSWLRRLINTFRPGRLHRDIDRELSFHIAERADQFRAEGLSAEEAARRARIQFGNPIVQRERTRDVDISGWVDAMMRNVRYAVRTLVHTPGFTVTVVLTLALGIGANTAVFSAVDAVLLRPLPFPDGDRLVLIEQSLRDRATPGWHQSGSRTGTGRTPLSTGSPATTSTMWSTRAVSCRRDFDGRSSRLASST